MLAANAIGTGFALEMFTIFGALGAFNACVAKFRLPGANLILPCLPVPLRFTICAELRSALSETIKVPVRTPAPVGENVSPIVHLALAAKVAPQVVGAPSMIAKSPVLSAPRNVTVRFCFLLFGLTTVTTAGLLTAPTPPSSTSAGKPRVFGVTLSFADSGGAVNRKFADAVDATRLPVPAKLAVSVRFGLPGIIVGAAIVQWARPLTSVEPMQLSLPSFSVTLCPTTATAGCCEMSVNDAVMVTGLPGIPPFALGLSV